MANMLHMETAQVHKKVPKLYQSQLPSHMEKFAKTLASVFCRLAAFFATEFIVPKKEKFKKWLVQKLEGKDCH